MNNNLSVHRLILSFLVLFLFAAAVAPASARKWTDKTGKFSVEAEFVKLADGKVTLRKTDGRVIAVPVEKLSEADRAVVTKLAAEAAKPVEPKKPVEPAKPVDPPKPDPPAKPDYDVQVETRAKWSSTTSIGSDGKEKPKDLQVIVDLTGKDAANASYYGLIKVTKAMAGSKSLKQKDNPFNFGGNPREKMVQIRRSGSFAKQPKDGVKVQLDFEHPGKVDTVTEIEGNVTLRTGGKRSEALIKGVAKLKQPPSMPELEDANVKLKFSRDNDGGLQVDISGNAEAVSSMTMVDSDGEKYENVYSGSGTINGKQHYSFHPEKGKMPSGARLLIKLITGQREIKVPFAATNLKVGSGEIGKRRLLKSSGRLREECGLLLEAFSFAKFSEFLEPRRGLRAGGPTDFGDAFRTESHRLGVGFGAVIGTVHQALVLNAVFERKHVADFVRGGLDCAFQC